jgi:hypothetical protein
VCATDDVYICVHRTVSDIPRLTTRLRLFLFKVQFSEQAEQVADSLKIVEEARGQIQNSQNLKSILEIVLAFGNYMNDKDAKGFQLSTLAKMKSAKARDKKTTLLTYLVQHVRKNCREAEGFLKECHSVPQAAEVESAFVTGEIKDLLSRLRELEEELRIHMSSEGGMCDASDHFEDVMSAFYKHARSKTKRLTLARNKLVAQTAELV